MATATMQVKRTVVLELTEEEATALHSELADSTTPIADVVFRALDLMDWRGE